MLSPEIWIEIMLLMDPLTLQNLCQSCLAIATISSDEYFWQLKLKHDFGLTAPNPDLTFKETWIRYTKIKEVVVSVPYKFLRIVQTQGPRDILPDEESVEELTRPLTSDEQTYFQKEIPKSVSQLIAANRDSIKNQQQHRLIKVMVTDSEIKLTYKYTLKDELSSYDDFRGKIDSIFHHHFYIDGLQEEDQSGFPRFTWSEITLDLHRDSFNNNLMENGMGLV